MANSKVKINDAGVRRLYADIAAKIEQADKSFRETHTGYPVDVIVADAPNAFPWLKGVNWNDYAMAVSNGTPFEFKLR